MKKETNSHTYKTNHKKFTQMVSDTYLGPCQTSKMKLFAQIVN